MNLLASFAVLAFAVSTATAHAHEAASDEAAGKIAVVDESILILEDGATFAISEGVSTEGLRPGSGVTVTFEEQDGQIVATAVAPAN